MTPLGYVFIIALSGAVLWFSPRKAVIAIVAAVCYLPQTEGVEIGGFNFTAIRFILLAGLIRVMTRGDVRQLRVNAIDKALIAYSLALAIISTLRVGTIAEMIYRTGCLYDIFLSYFVFRSLIKKEDDLYEIFARIAYMIAPFALLMFYETLTSTNPFSIFRGVPVASMIRDGVARSQGSFRSPITAGAYGATFAILFAGMIYARVHRRASIVGLIASTLIVISSHSSGPLLGLLLGIAALTCWRFRQHTRSLRWGILFTLVGLHIVMKAPVWFLLGRISDVVGGGGYHRSYLIDQFVSHFDSWWLLGTSDTEGWMPTQLVLGGADLTNRFVADGVAGGLIGLILSVMLVVRCFQHLGLALRRIQINRLAHKKFVWALGSTLVGSIGVLFSVTYFDQMHVVWYFLLACIGIINIRNQKGFTPNRRKPSAKPEFYEMRSI
jgi:hypothetical protein